MGLIANIRRDIRFAKGLGRLLKRIKPVTLDSLDLVCDDLEEAVDRFGDRPAVEDERRSVSYREFDQLANRFGHWARGRNLKRGDVVALCDVELDEVLGHDSTVLDRAGVPKLRMTRGNDPGNNLS